MSFINNRLNSSNQTNFGNFKAYLNPYRDREFSALSFLESKICTGWEGHDLSIEGNVTVNDTGLMPKNYTVVTGKWRNAVTDRQKQTHMNNIGDYFTRECALQTISAHDATVEGPVYRKKPRYF